MLSRLAIAVAIVLSFCANVSARYCNSPNCAMCNRLFGYLPGYEPIVAVPKVESTPMSVVEQMLAVAELKPHDVLYDIGCGDGRFLELAVRKYGCQAVGIEKDATVANAARRRLSAMKDLPKRWRIVTGDANDYKLDGATVVVMYLFPDTMRQMLPKLTGCTRILSYSHAVPGYTCRKFSTSLGPFYLVDWHELIAIPHVRVRLQVEPKVVIPAVRLCIGRT